MSIPVELGDLASRIDEFGTTCFLMTGGADNRPHVTQVAVTLDGSVITCTLGRRTAGNAQHAPLVALLWPPLEPGGYSMIADGEITVDQHDETSHGRISITRAVLHRPAAQAEPSAATTDVCTSDCVEINLPETTS